MQKIYKPYDIVSGMRSYDYKPKFQLPNVTWDRYDREKFRDFKLKDLSQQTIVKMKNQQLSNYDENTTTNMAYGKPN